MTRSFRLISIALITTLFALAGTVHAESRFEEFTPERFQSLQEQGRSVLINVWAPWCPTCRNQGPKLEALLAEPAFSEFAGLKLHWDDQRTLAKGLGAPRQSTVFIFKGADQRAMSVAETNIDRLRDVLKTGLD